MITKSGTATPYTRMSAWTRGSLASKAIRSWASKITLWNVDRVGRRNSKISSLFMGNSKICSRCNINRGTVGCIQFRAKWVLPTNSSAEIATTINWRKIISSQTRLIKIFLKHANKYFRPNWNPRVAPSAQFRWDPIALWKMRWA